MRGDWLECTSSSGGTGDLTLTASHGFPLLSAPWTGIRQVRATILEYNSDPSSTNANLIRAENGYGPLTVSGPTLNRSDSTWTVFSSYDGTTYLPNEGVTTHPSKQSFGTVANNIRIICSWGAEDNIFFAPITGFGSGQGPIGFPTTGFYEPSITASGVIQYYAFVWPGTGLYSTMVMNMGQGGGSGASSLQAAIYEVSKTGRPGRQLANFGSLGDLTTSGNKTSAALSQPILLVPGWYYLAVLPIYASGSGNMDGLVYPVNGPSGVVFPNNTGSVQAVFLGFGSNTGQTTLPDPAVAIGTTIFHNQNLVVLAQPSFALR